MSNFGSFSRIGNGGSYGDNFYDIIVRMMSHEQKIIEYL